MHNVATAQSTVEQSSRVVARGRERARVRATSAASRVRRGGGTNIDRSSTVLNSARVYRYTRRTRACASSRSRRADYDRDERLIRKSPVFNKLLLFEVIFNLIAGR